MKKLTSIVLFMVIALILISPEAGAFSESSYRVYFGDDEIVFDVTPFEYDNRVLVPIRAVSEVTGAVVNWDGTQATVLRGTDQLVLLPEVNTALFNNFPISIDVAPMMRNSRLFLPLRFVSEWLGLEVNQVGHEIMMRFWDEDVPDTTMQLPRGVMQGNILNRTVIWRNRLIKTQTTSNDILSIDLDSGDVRNLGPVSTFRIHGFHIWEDKLFVSITGGDYNSKLVQINEYGQIVDTVIENAGDIVMYDGWLYYTKRYPDFWSTPQLYRRLISGGEEQNLGVRAPFSFFVNDQHVFAIVEGALIRMNHDGTGRRQLISLPRISTIEEYVDGLLFIAIGDEQSEDGFLLSLHTDGTGLRILYNSFVSDLFAHDGYIYFLTRTVPSFQEGSHLGPGRPHWFQRKIIRAEFDGSNPQILASTEDTEIIFMHLNILSDGSIVYMTREGWKDVVY